MPYSHTLSNASCSWLPIPYRYFTTSPIVLKISPKKKKGKGIYDQEKEKIKKLDEDEDGSDEVEEKNKRSNNEPEEIPTQVRIEMKRMKDILDDQLSRHFSLQTNLHDFEEINVNMDNKKYKMNHLGRITVKNPQAIMINFTDNPGAVKHAMKALMDKNPELGAEQDGIVIHINLPRLTREYRENLAKNAVKIFNEYKIKLDKVYTEFAKKNQRTASKDLSRKISEEILKCKKQFEEEGKKMLAERQKEIMKEIH
ncbi:ribosome recycling factor domain-containing protein [Ditylenchus destructor]|uniref:Ribosome-recycling factor, mitochondrial n=1 Tax=Ditylenchus destructor TaxID=166010 RepID=A0AAD4N7A8_9BILA|nr:ribosome recycling factor domain-containing protein [Ditylenchus destructor]